MLLSKEELQLERRQSKRIGFDGPVTCQISHVNRIDGCLGCDVSDGGLKAIVHYFVPVQTEVHIQVKLGEITGNMEFQSKVRWIIKIPYSEMYYIGFQFQQPNVISQRRIRIYIQSRPC